MIRIGSVRRCSLELRDPRRQIGARAPELPRRFEDRRAQIGGNELEFVGRKAIDETACFGAGRALGTGDQSIGQFLSLRNHTP